MSTNLQRAGACRVLGPDHPLARVSAQIATAVEQCLAVSLALAVGVYALIDDLSIGAPLTVAAATCWPACSPGSVPSSSRVTAERSI